MNTQELMKSARSARTALAAADTQTKNKALEYMAQALENNTEAILAANAEDVESQRGIISDVMLDRLALSEERIQGMAEGIRQVAALPDPVGKVLDSHERPNGIKITKVLVPMGVIREPPERNVRRGSSGDQSRICLCSQMRQRSTPIRLRDRQGSEAWTYRRRPSGKCHRAD